MDELINDFLAETRDMLQALSGEIVAWRPIADRARLDEIFRFVHTVKAIAASSTCRASSN